MQARAGENVAGRVFFFPYFSSPATACKFHEPQVGFVRTVVVRVPFARFWRDATFFLPCSLSLSLVYFARLANIASRRRELTYVYAENWKYRAVYYREDDVSVPLPYGNSALPIFQGKIGYRC